MEAKKYLTNRSFCPVPWTGLMYNYDGSVKNCIRSLGEIGNIKDDSIENILSGKINTKNKQLMINEQPVDTCNSCYNLEKNEQSFDIISDRVFYLKELKTVNRNIYDTSTNFDLYTTDIRWTNLCNFACVYCFPRFSSKWASELGIQQPAPTDQQRTEFKQYIFENAHKLKHVYLAGGEPLLMKENLELLELLIKVNPLVQLRVNTNLSKTDTNVFESVNKFKNVHWTVSVETIGDEYEYIRHGGSWRDFMDNLSVIRQSGHKISFNMLYFLLNYRSLFDCVEYFQAMGFHNNSFIIGGLVTPEYLNVRHLPDRILNEVKEEFKQRINLAPGHLLENSYRNLLSYLEEPWTKDLADSFVKLAELDRRRGLNSSKIFTELYKLK